MVTPHYLAECVMYLALSLLAAPEGQILNKTIASALVFELVNLGITANETHKWYERQFGAAKLQTRARMIPGVW
jgi:3-oxo-5-alpha-steroid 4-dehydrogenase 3